ncbi:MAG: cytochrome c biogenesis protein ResB [Victivallaceae bacterium]
MKDITHFFLSRSTILVLIILLLSTMLLASFIPQVSLMTPVGHAMWRADYPQLAPLAEQLGLTHIYTDPVFAVILLLFVLSLVFSCREQIRLAIRSTFGNADRTTGENIVTKQSISEIINLLSARGYRCIHRSAVVRMVRNPWGYWGNVLFHVGVLVVIVSSLWIAVTQQRGMINLAEGEVFRPGQKWLTTERGMLAKPFLLDQGVRIDKLSYEFLPNYAVKKIASTLTFFDDVTPIASRSVMVNQPLNYEGLRIYQGAEFGHAFYITVTMPDGKKNVVELQLKHPDRPELASYEDYRGKLGKGDVVRVKYFVDSKKSSFDREDPLLVLRIEKSGSVLGQVSLMPGQEGTVAGYGFRLEQVGKWSNLIFVKLNGIPGVFIGFFIICLGGVLHYFTPPREASIYTLPEGGARIVWRATRFAGFYLEEFKCLEAQLSGEKADG